MGNWYTRPVVRVRDTSRALEFYGAKLGFKEDWRHVDEGVSIVQVSRQGCELILSDQWPQEAGGEVLFISLDEPDFQAMRREFAERAVEMKAGQWGYQLLVLEDPDGNRLWFPHPSPAPRAD
jgi:catechol 2,3-dioxygenase-like lactoylglutathione lyase family enzyme